MKREKYGTKNNVKMWLFAIAVLVLSAALCFPVFSGIKADAAADGVVIVENRQVTYNKAKQYVTPVDVSALPGSLVYYTLDKDEQETTTNSNHELGEFVTVGTYTVYYRVERAGVNYDIGEVKVTINKAEFTFALPVSSDKNPDKSPYGSPLSSWELSGGWEWVNDADVPDVDGFGQAYIEFDDENYDFKRDSGDNVGFTAADGRIIGNVSVKPTPLPAAAVANPTVSNGTQKYGTALSSYGLTEGWVWAEPGRNFAAGEHSPSVYLEIELTQSKNYDYSNIEGYTFRGNRVYIYRTVNITVEPAETVGGNRMSDENVYFILYMTFGAAVAILLLVCFVIVGSRLRQERYELADAKDDLANDPEIYNQDNYDFDDDEDANGGN